MTRGLIFWVLMLIWFVFQLALFAAPTYVGHWGPQGSALLDFILFFSFRSLYEKPSEI